MWDISKRLIVERNGRKFGTRGPTVHICRVLLMPDSLSLVWDHLVHFAKFPIPRFSKHYSLNNFIQSIIIRGWYRLLIFLPICPKLKILWHFVLLTQDHMGLEISNATPPTVFISCQPTFMRTLENLGLGVLQCIYVGCFLMPDSLSLVWGHSVHFAKFPIPWFSKHYSFNSFY